MAQVYTLNSTTAAYTLSPKTAELTWSNHIFGDVAAYVLAGVNAAQKHSVILTDGVSFNGFVVPTDNVVLAQTVGFAAGSSALAYSYRPGALISETVGFDDALAVNAKIMDTLTDGARFDHTISFGFPKELTETVGFNAGLTVSQSVLLLQTIGFDDITAEELTYNMTLAETVRFQDVLSRFIHGSISNAVGFAEALTPLYRPQPELTDTVGFDDALTPKMLFSLTVQDDANFTDTALLNMIFSGVLTDVVKFSAAYVAPNGTITTWALNVSNSALTQYDNYEFNSFAHIGPHMSHYVGATSEGLYLLEGSRDEGENIVSRIRSGFAQFGGSRLSGLKAAYIAMRGSGEFYFKLITGDGQIRTYRVKQREQTDQDYRIAQTRVDIGKGIRNRFIAFELEGVGPDFDLESVEFVPMVAQRRI